MMARKKKQEGKNDAYTEKVPQDVAKNKSRTLKSVTGLIPQFFWPTLPSDWFSSFSCEQAKFCSPC
jgi:hypothetical protein